MYTIIRFQNILSGGHLQKLEPGRILFILLVRFLISATETEIIHN